MAFLVAAAWVDHLFEWSEFCNVLLTQAVEG